MIYGPQAMEHLKQTGIVVYLKLSFSEIESRLGELKKRGVEHLPVCWSDETPVRTGEVVGSLPFVPSVMGLLMAEYIVKELIK